MVFLTSDLINNKSFNCNIKHCDYQGLSLLLISASVLHTIFVLPFLNT